MNTPRKKSAADGDTVYTISEIGSGSAGTEYELLAVKSADGLWITLNAVEQSEVGEPPFALAWGVMETARIEK
jgi:hypothetical protein